MVTFDAAEAGTSAEAWSTGLRERPVAPLELSLGAVTRLIVVAAHPDDETLGAGGLIAACASRGIPVSVVVVTDGGASGVDGIVERRAAEARAAVRAVAPTATMQLLGFTDGGTLEDRAAIEAALQPVLHDLPAGVRVAAPWRGDGHVDHRVVGEVVAGLVPAEQLLEYPIWMWHWASPDDPAVPWAGLRSVAIDPDAKARALAEYPSQTEGTSPMLRADFLQHFAGDAEYFVAGDMAPLPPDGGYFDALYDSHDDPWGFESRAYEARKRAVTLASLPADRFDRALEIGCSIGVLTDLLAERCDDLLAVDVSQAAVDRARERVGSRARVDLLDVSQGMPPGPFDLIVLSEVGYYFDQATLDAVLASAADALTAGGSLLACHWRHPVADYPLSGDQVHARLALLATQGLTRLVSHLEEDFVLEVYSRDPRSVAARTGLR